MNRSSAGLGRKVPASHLVSVAFALTLPLLASGPVAFHLDSLKAVVFACGGLAVVLSSPRSHPTRIHPILLAYLLFITTLVVPALWNHSGYTRWDHLSRHFISWVVLYCLSGYRWEPGDRRALHLSIVAAATAVAAVGLLEAAGLIVLYGKVDPLQSHVIATTGNPSYLAGLLAASIPLTIAAIRNGNKALLWPSLAVQSLAMILSLNRSGWLVAVAAIAVVVLLVRPARFSSATRRQRAARVAFGCMALAAAIAAAMLIPAVQQRVLRTVGDGWSGLRNSLDVRIQIWKSAASMLADGGLGTSLFGRGPGAFYREMFTHYPSDFRLFTLERGAQWAHNEVLDTLVEGGALQLLAGILLAGTLLRHLFGELRRNHLTTKDSVIAAGSIAALFALLLHSMVNVTLRTTTGHVMTTAIMALAIAVSDDQGLGIARRCRNSVVERVVLVLVVGIASIPLVTGFGSDVWLLRATESARSSSPDASDHSRMISRALAWDPANVHALYEGFWVEKDVDPAAAVSTALELDALIPHYRQVDRIRGIALSGLQQYESAYISLAAYIERDAIEPGAYVHGIATLCMAGRESEAAALLEELLRWQVRYFERNPGQHVGLSFPVDSIVSPQQAAEITQAITANRWMGYDWAHANTLLNIAVVFDRANFGDVEIDYYLQVLLAGRMDPELRNYVHGKTLIFVDEVERLRIAAETSGESERARALLSRQIQLMDAVVLLRPAEEVILAREALMSLYRQNYQ